MKGVILYNDTLLSGEVPESWKLAKFMLLPKSRHARVPADYRPIASVRLFYKIFVYMMLARMEPALVIHQPVEQHGFRKRHRIEEHSLTANFVVDKLLAVNTRRMASLPTWCGQCKTLTLGSWGKYKVTPVILVFFLSRMA